MQDEVELDQIRRDIEKQGPRNPGRRYPPELKGRVVAWVKRRRTEGIGAGEIAGAVGIPWESLTRWSREVTTSASMASEAFRPVRFRESAPQPAKSGLTLRTPRGFLVEGLDVAALMELLARLG